MAGITRFHWSAKGAFFLIALLVGCLAAALATRASFTNYNEGDPFAFSEMRYSVSPALPEMLGSEESVLSSYGVDGARELLEGSDLIVLGEFEGARSYTYLAFLSRFAVSDVLRGDPAFEGRTIPVFEGVRVASFRNDVGQVVGAELQPTAGPALYGCNMLRTGQSYVLFLDFKQYAASDDRGGGEQEFVLKNSPYAVLPVVEAGSSDDVAVYDCISDDVFASDSSRCSMFVSDSEARALYVNARDGLLAFFGLN